MRMQEKQTDKVIIDATRSIHGDRQEHDWVRLIRVELTIMWIVVVCFITTQKLVWSNLIGHTT